MAYCEVLFINGNPRWASIESSSMKSLRKFLKEEYKDELAKEKVVDEDDYKVGEENEWGYTEAFSYHDMIDMIKCYNRVWYEGEYLSLEKLYIDPEEDVSDCEEFQDISYEEEIDSSLFKPVKTGDSVFVAYFDNWSDHQAIAAFSSYQPDLTCDGQEEIILS